MTAPPVVFVIDDEEGVRTSLARLIRLIGYDSQSFGSAQEFLSSDAARQTGCLLVDLRMPGMSGIELLEEVRRRELPLAAIVMSGHADADIFERLKTIETIGVLEKPFALDALKEMLERWRPSA